MLVVLLQVVGLQLCQKTMGAGRSRQVQPALDLAQVAEAATKLSSLLEQVINYGYDYKASEPLAW